MPAPAALKAAVSAVVVSVPVYDLSFSGMENGLLIAAPTAVMSSPIMKPLVVTAVGLEVEARPPTGTGLANVEFGAAIPDIVYEVSSG